ARSRPRSWSLLPRGRRGGVPGLPKPRVGSSARWSLRYQDCPRASRRARLAVGGRQVVGRVPAVQHGVGHVPGPYDRFGEDGAAVGGRALLVRVIAADADDEEEGYFEVV